VHRNRQNENPRISRIGKTWETQPNRFTPQAQGCWTQDEIAESEGMSQPAVLAILSEFPELEKLIKSSQTLATYGAPSCTWVKRMWTVRAALCASRRYDGRNCPKTGRRGVSALVADYQIARATGLFWGVLGRYYSGLTGITHGADEKMGAKNSAAGTLWDCVRGRKAVQPGNRRAAFCCLWAENTPKNVLLSP